MKDHPKASSRRAFLSAAGAASVAAAAERPIRPGVTARSASRVVGANDRVRVGMIGMGGMGTVHLQAFLKQADEEKDIQVAAVCDVYTKRKQRARDIASSPTKKCITTIATSWRAMTWMRS